jgi:hypothetical protein
MINLLKIIGSTVIILLISFVVLPHLVAQSGVHTYTVIYVANTDSNIGHIPQDFNEYNAGDKVTVMEGPDVILIGNEHGFPGLKFSGWNLCPCGKKENYMPGDTFIMPARNVVLYANWVSLAKPGTLYGLEQKQ